MFCLFISSTILYNICVATVGRASTLFINLKNKLKTIFAILRHYKGLPLVGGKLSRYFDIWIEVLHVFVPYLLPKWLTTSYYDMYRCDGDIGFSYKTGTSRSKRKLNDLDYADDIALLEMCSRETSTPFTLSVKARN